MWDQRLELGTAPVVSVLLTGFLSGANPFDCLSTYLHEKHKLKKMTDGKLSLVKRTTCDEKWKIFTYNEIFYESDPCLSMPLSNNN